MTVAELRKKLEGLPEGSSDEEEKAMTVFRVRYQTLGGHVHCRVFAAPSPDTFAKIGDLVVRVDEFAQLRIALPMVEFIESEIGSTPQTVNLREAAAALLDAIDRTIFYDLGLRDDGDTDKAEDGFEDDDALDGGRSAKLTAGHVRRLRESLA